MRIIIKLFINIRTQRILIEEQNAERRKRLKEKLYGAV